MPEESENLAEAVQDPVSARPAEAHEQDARPKWLEPLALTTALVAVIAAFASLKAGDTANEALYSANNAVLQLARAVDVWSEFQADSVKRYQASTLAALLLHVGGSSAALQAAKTEVAKRQNAQDALKRDAQQLAVETKQVSEDVKLLLARHTKCALGVTLFQVPIGLAAIATLVRRRPLWFGSFIVGVGASVALIAGFLTHASTPPRIPAFTAAFSPVWVGLELGPILRRFSQGAPCITCILSFSACCRE